MTNELDRVSQALRDERVLRQKADDRAAQATEKARIWRRRAEERAERIRELVDSKRPIIGRRRPSEPASTIHQPETPLPKKLVWRAHPAIRVATATKGSDTDHVLSMFDTVTFEGAPPPDADVVLVSPALVQRWTADEIEAFRAWAGSPARAPLVADGGESLPFTAETVAVPAGAFTSFQIKALELDQPDDLVRIGADELIHPNIIAGAALGLPLAVGDANPSIAQASAAARRWAYRYHHPRVKASRFLSAVGVPAPDPTPLVSAALVSNRPGLVPDQVRLLADQTHPRLEILIGLHGCEPTDELREVIERVSDKRRVTVTTLASSLSLGECLNVVIGSGTGGIIAKIDDDDFYGPAYLEDALHAFDYSRSDIVGKATQFTYLAETDETVVRRAGQEERLMGGTPTGASMLTTRRLWSDVRFPHRPRFVDSVFVRGARAEGATVYATSRWEFCYVRQEEGHTWAASSSELRASSDPAFPGFDSRRVVVGDDCSGLTPPPLA